MSARLWGNDRNRRLHQHRGRRTGFLEGPPAGDAALGPGGEVVFGLGQADHVHVLVDGSRFFQFDQGQVVVGRAVVPRRVEVQLGDRKVLLVALGLVQEVLTCGRNALYRGQHEASNAATPPTTREKKKQ